MEYEAIRKLVIIAMFSDDWLMERVVLKGGNALALVHGLDLRTSLDLDFSLSTDFPDFEAARERIVKALTKTFEPEGLLVIDPKFEPKPHVTPVGRERWGGYLLSFKVIEVDEYRRRSGVANIGMYALVVGPAQQRTFTVDFSKYEYCDSKQEAEIDNYVIYVYTPLMIAIEKVRALCQQMPAYPLNRHKRPRARDFYDIHSIATRFEVDFNDAATRNLVRQIFSAKEVPLQLVSQLPDQREFHRPDWPAVENSTSKTLREFDYYFDFVVSLTRPLETLGNE